MGGRGSGVPFVKGHKRMGGRKKGTVNHATARMREVVEQAIVKLGGIERLVAWAKESPENERAFWTQIAIKLLPVQLTGENGDSIKIEGVTRTIIDPPKLVEGPVIDAEPVVPDDGRNDSAKWAN